MLRFDNQVVIVTGAGGGLGRAFALAFASRGAKVLVNDNKKTDEGFAAENVVQEIRSAGGVAIANTDSVEEAESVVRSAMSAFGRIDVLVSNAGILSSRKFEELSQSEWARVHQVNSHSAYLLAQQVWPIMSAQKQGRLVLIGSSAGFFGSENLAHYASSKASVFALARSLALEGAQNGIRCNVIAPMASTALTAGQLAESDASLIPACQVAPFALWLSHELCQETGAAFYVGGGWCSPLKVLLGSGVHFRDVDGNVTLEVVRDRWQRMKSLPTTVELQSVGQSYVFMMEKLAKEAKQRKQLSEFDDLIGLQAEDVVQLSRADTSLYAVAIGAGLSNSNDLKLFYEKHADWSPLATCLVPKALQVCTTYVSQWWRQLNANPLHIMHGEHYFELFDYSAFVDNIDSDFTVQLAIEDVVDKGKGVLVIMKADVLSRSKKLVASNQFCFFQIAGRGKALNSKSDKQIALAEASVFLSKPDAVLEEGSNANQAALYRLTGDMNPIHVDPQVAASVGMPQPVLHGLCTFGFALRHVLTTYANNNSAALKSIKVRFSRPVIAGQTLRTEMWLGANQNGVQRIFVQCKTVESGEVCLANSYVDLLAQHLVLAPSS